MKTSAYLKPYWSRQHGAYITMLVSWLIAVLLSDEFSWIQPIILIFLLTSLNAIELIIDAFSRKSKIPKPKKFWLYIYSVLTTLILILLLIRLKVLVYLFPVFFIFAFIFFYLALRKEQKSIIAEWITFAMFSLAGLLAYNPGQMPSYGILISLSMIMSAYFGQSIFLVKARLGRISDYAVLLYSVFVITSLFYFLGFDLFTILLSSLFILKSMQTIFFSTWYKGLKIKWIGMLEMFFHFVFLFLVMFCSKIVLGYQESIMF